MKLSVRGLTLLIASTTIAASISTMASAVSPASATSRAILSCSINTRPSKPVVGSKFTAVVLNLKNVGNKTAYGVETYMSSEHMSSNGNVYSNPLGRYGDPLKQLGNLKPGSSITKTVMYYTVPAKLGGTNKTVNAVRMGATLDALRNPYAYSTCNLELHT